MENKIKNKKPNLIALCAKNNIRFQNKPIEELAKQYEKQKNYLANEAANSVYYNR